MVGKIVGYITDLKSKKTQKNRAKPRKTIKNRGGGKSPTEGTSIKKKVTFTENLRGPKKSSGLAGYGRAA